MKPSDSRALLIESILELIASLEPDLPALFSGTCDAARRAALGTGALHVAGAPDGAGTRPAAGEAAHRSLPVLQVVAKLCAPELPVRGELLERFRRAAPALEWRQTYADHEVEAAFLENYGWTELIGPRAGCLGSELAVGLLLLGPETSYPPHRHEAEEVYVPLSGTAEWRRGLGPWQRHACGALIHHCREETHAMRTSAEPLLALYLWRSRDLWQHASLVRGAA